MALSVTYTMCPLPGSVYSVKCGLQAVCPLAHWPQCDSVHTGKKIEGSVLEIQFGTGLSEPPPIGYCVETEKEMQTVKTKVLGVYPCDGKCCVLSELVETLCHRCSSVWWTSTLTGIKQLDHMNPQVLLL